MTTAVDTVMPNLAAILRSVEGVKRAYANMPGTLNVNDMPCAVIAPGPANYQWAESDEDAAEGIETRQYTISLYVLPVGAGVEGEAFAACIPFLERVITTLVAHQDALQSGIGKLVYQSDTGVVSNMAYDQQQAWGIRFTVQVIGRVRVPYADYE